MKYDKALVKALIQQGMPADQALRLAQAHYMMNNWR